MTAIREFAKVNNHILNCLIILIMKMLKPRIDKDDFSHLSDAIEIGMKSAISDKSHDEIFAEIKSK